MSRRSQKLHSHYLIIPPWWNWGQDSVKWASEWLSAAIALYDSSWDADHQPVGQTGKEVYVKMATHINVNPIVQCVVCRHNSNPGHHMDLKNPMQVFHSDCYNTRVTVEAALIYAAPTVKNNTDSTSVEHNDIVASIICRSTEFNWK